MNSCFCLQRAEECCLSYFEASAKTGDKVTEVSNYFQLKGCAKLNTDFCMLHLIVFILIHRMSIDN